MQRISRAQGRSVVGASAYRSGLDLLDERTGETHYYAHRQAKGDIGECLLILPSGNMPDRGEFWNSVEKHHRRGDANLAWEYEVSLPVELSHEQNKDLAFRYARHLAKRYGVAVDACIHRSHDGKNPHVHILLSACSVGVDDKLGKKCTALDPIHCERNRIANPAHSEREIWQDLQNEALEAAGFDVRVDHRSLEAQGVERAPQRHEGKYNPEDIWAEIVAYNTQIERDEAEKAALLAEDEAITARLKALYSELRAEELVQARQAEINALMTQERDLRAGFMQTAHRTLEAQKRAELDKYGDDPFAEVRVTHAPAENQAYATWVVVIRKLEKLDALKELQAQEPPKQSLLNRLFGKEQPKREPETFNECIEFANSRRPQVKSWIQEEKDIKAKWAKFDAERAEQFERDRQKAEDERAAAKLREENNLRIRAERVAERDAPRPQPTPQKPKPADDYSPGPSF